MPIVFSIFFINLQIRLDIFEQIFITLQGVGRNQQCITVQTRDFTPILSHFPQIPIKTDTQYYNDRDEDCNVRVKLSCESIFIDGNDSLVEFGNCVPMESTHIIYLSELSPCNQCISLFQKLSSVGFYLKQQVSH